MLYLHKNENDPLGEKIKDALQDMSAAHKQVDIEEGESFLKENEIEIKGAEQIFNYLRAYKSDLNYTQSLGADACVVRKDGDGKVC
ncbi:hypothetical protein [Fulvivirga sp.]|uniref:hypothetical protein n=1 Tax=Fulvivirga sp. TaxID=1931237 RepID=UPI0032EED40E